MLSVFNKYFSKKKRISNLLDINLSNIFPDLSP